jgi:hypothetical protein
MTDTTEVEDDFTSRERGLPIDFLAPTEDDRA